MKDITAVYYTCNREDESFESKIRMKLLQVIGNSPLISVSHKPIDGFGVNICVGDRFPCDYNAHRQLLIGMQAAKTRWIACAEADVLYPPGYFNYAHARTDIVARYPNVWILNKWRNRQGMAQYHQKFYSECAQIAGRDYWIKAVASVLAGYPEWVDEAVSTRLIFKGFEWMDRPASVAVINFKTGKGLRTRTGCIRGIYPRDEMDHWGTATALRREMFGDEIDTPAPA